MAAGLPIVPQSTTFHVDDLRSPTQTHGVGSCLFKSCKAWCSVADRRKAGFAFRACERETADWLSGLLNLFPAFTPGHKGGPTKGFFGHGLTYTVKKTPPLPGSTTVVVRHYSPGVRSKPKFGLTFCSRPQAMHKLVCKARRPVLLPEGKLSTDLMEWCCWYRVEKGISSEGDFNEVG